MFLYTYPEKSIGSIHSALDVLTESQLQKKKSTIYLLNYIGGIKQEFCLYRRNNLHKTQQMTAAKQVSYSAKGCSFKKKVLFIAYVLIREMMLLSNLMDR